MAEWFTVLCCGLPGQWVSTSTNTCEQMICKFVDQKGLAAMLTRVLHKKIERVTVWFLFLMFSSFAVMFC